MPAPTGGATARREGSVSTSPTSAAVSPAAQRRRLGAALRELREKADLRLEDAAAVLRCSTSKVSRLESGKASTPRERDVRDLVAHYGGSEQLSADLQALAVHGQDGGWWDEFKDLLSEKLLDDHLRRFVALEEYASAITAYVPDLVPGLLQTEEYAAAVADLVLAGRSDALRRRFVEFRLRRQRILDRANPPRLTFLVGQAALHRPIGGTEVLGRQFDVLIKLIAADDPARVVRIVPTALLSPAVLGGPFSVMVFDDPADQDVVYIEGRLAASYLESDHDVDEHTQMLADLEAACSTEQSLELIEEARRTLL